VETRCNTYNGWTIAKKRKIETPSQFLKRCSNTNGAVYLVYSIPNAVWRLSRWSHCQTQCGWWQTEVYESGTIAVTLRWLNQRKRNFKLLIAAKEWRYIDSIRCYNPERIKLCIIHSIDGVNPAVRSFTASCDVCTPSFTRLKQTPPIYSFHHKCKQVETRCNTCNGFEPSQSKIETPSQFFLKAMF
jgi:hypothetical protein